MSDRLEKLRDTFPINFTATRKTQEQIKGLITMVEDWQHKKWLNNRKKKSDFKSCQSNASQHLLAHS